MAFAVVVVEVESAVSVGMALVAEEDGMRLPRDATVVGSKKAAKIEIIITMDLRIYMLGFLTRRIRF